MSARIVAGASVSEITFGPFLRHRLPKNLQQSFEWQCFGNSILLRISSVSSLPRAGVPFKWHGTAAAWARRANGAAKPTGDLW